MLEIHVERETTADADAVLDTLRDPSPERRGEVWSNITAKRFELHEAGEHHIDVTEGTFVVGEFWERCRYEWGDPGRVRATVLDSNVFRPASFTELRATPREDGGSQVELVVRREFQPGFKGRIAGAVNHLGGHRMFGWYLGSALRALEKRSAASGG